jgi:hypothetical protein
VLQFGVGSFCPDFDALQGAYFLGLPQKDQVVLVVEIFLETIKIGFEADGVRVAEGIAFAFGFVRDLGKTSKAEVEVPFPPRVGDSRVECAVPMYVSGSHSGHVFTSSMSANSLRIRFSQHKPPEIAI